MTDLMSWGVGPTGADLLSKFPTTPVASDEEMLANASVNIDRGLPVIRPCGPHEHVLSVAAGGPSLCDTWQGLKAPVLAVNGSLAFLQEKGVTPWGCVAMDPAPYMKEIIPRVEGVHYFIASICDPSLFDHLEGLKIGIWHPGGAPGLRGLLEEKRGTNWTMVAGGSTMGVRSLSLGYTLGFRNFEFHGLDSSYRDEGEWTHAYPDFTDGEDHMVIDGWHTKLAFVRQVSDFFTMLDIHGEPDMDPITIEVHGTGWLQDRWHEFKRLNPGAFTGVPVSTAEEKDKYTRMWGHEAYRGSSPGEHLVPETIKALDLKPGDSLIDFGCGPARATQLLQDIGLKVLGIDIADNCRDPDVDVPLRVACLWELPDDIEAADYGLCCDVMEHIPPEHVDAVLDGIRRLTKKGVVFNIAFAADNYGKLIGERLHLTVRSEGWWLDKLKARWGRVELIDRDPRAPRSAFACFA